MHIIVVQSLGTGPIKEAIESQFGKILTEHIIYTDSFDKAVKLMPRVGLITVITSDMFHDEDKVGGMETQTIPHESKSAEKLAQYAKQINPKAKVYCYSEYIPKGEAIDGFIKKGKDINKDVLEIFKSLEY